MDLLNRKLKGADLDSSNRVTCTGEQQREARLAGGNGEMAGAKGCCCYCWSLAVVS